MLLFAIIIFCAMWFAMTYFFERKVKSQISGRDAKYFGARGAAMVIAFLMFIGLVIGQLSVNYEMAKTKQKIVQLEAQRTIYADRKVVLFAPFKNMLDSNYGSHEKELYKMITGNRPVTSGAGMNFNINLYPGIKYASTLTDLSNRLQTLTDKIYEQTLAIEQERYWLRQIKSSPWIIGWLLQSSE